MATSRRTGRASWQLRVNGFVLAWFAAALIVGVTPLHLLASLWLMVHLLLLGGAMTATLIWSEHFAEALLHLPPAPRSESLARLTAFQVGAVAVVIGQTTGLVPLTFFGGSVTSAVVSWHGIVLAARARSARKGRLALAGRHGYVVRYYVAAMAWFVVAAAAGTWLGTGSVPQPWDDRLHLLHVETMLFGVMMLTIIGTLFTLWPTMLRAFMPDDTKAVANRALLLLCGGLVLCDAGVLIGSAIAATVGLLVVAIGIGVGVALFARSGKSGRRWDAPTTSVGMATLWLAGSIVANAYVLLTARPFTTAGDRTSVLVLPLAVGFVGQVLIGSMTYLLPVVAGGGPTSVRSAIVGIGQWWKVRALALNVGMLLLVLPIQRRPALLSIAGELLVAVSLVAFISLAARLLLSRSRVRSRT